MGKFLLALLLLTTTLAAPAGAGFRQNKKPQCEEGPRGQRNWELIDRDYVYFDYILCPADVDPPKPLVSIWITARGNGIAVDQWSQDRDGADNVSVYRGKKKAYTLFRDLKAIPLKMLTAERRPGIPADMASQPFVAEGLDLIPFKSLTPDSAERARKVFENADTLIKKARGKMLLLYEAPRIAAIVKSLDSPLKAQK